MSQFACKASISGSVQGLGFRFHTVQKAEQLGVSGFVENLSDGRVLVLAEGTLNQLQRLLDWLQSGPPSARVASVESEWITPTSCKGFKIR